MPTIDGPEELEIPAGTQPHETIMLRGAGMPSLRGRRHGDLRVVVNVITPRNLTPAQRELLEQLNATLTPREPRTATRACSRSCVAPSTSSGAMLRLAVRVRRADAELVLAELLELAPSGVEEVDIDTGTVEYAVYGAPGELPELPDLEAAAGDALVDVSTSEVADDWADRWREFHKPLVLGDRLSVRPPWEPPQATALDLVIDPGRAFGTGAHATTRLCLELLLELEPRRAVELGRRHQIAHPAVDRPRLRLRRARDRRRQARLGARCWRSTTTSWPSTRPWRTLPSMASRTDRGAALRSAAASRCRPRRSCSANLLRPLLLAWSAAMAGTRATAWIVASGLLDRRGGLPVSRSFRRARLRERTRLISGEWAALLLEAPDRG